jgi:hypothetical protein
MEFSAALTSLTPPPRRMIDYKKIDWSWVAMGMKKPDLVACANGHDEMGAKGVCLVNNAIDILEMNGVFSDGLIPSGEVNRSVKRLSDQILLYDFDKGSISASGLVSMSDRFESIRGNTYRSGSLPAPGGFVFLSPGRSRIEARNRLLACIEASLMSESNSDADVELFDSYPVIFGNERCDGSLSMLDRIGESVGLTAEREAELIYIGSRDVKLGRQSRVYLV